MTYVRVKNQASKSQAQDNGQATRGDSHKDKIGIHQFSFLPKMIYERHEEFTYLSLVDDIISHGVMKSDRTGLGTLSKFGCQVCYLSFYLFCLW